MAKINLSLGNYKSFFTNFFKNLSWMFFFVFLVLLILEFFVVKHSFNIILDINQTPVLTTIDKGARVDFDSYNAIVKQINDAQNFSPNANISKDPFNPFVPTPSGPPSGSDSGGLLQLP